MKVSVRYFASIREEFGAKLVGYSNADVEAVILLAKASLQTCGVILLLTRVIPKRADLSSTRFVANAIKCMARGKKWALISLLTAELISNNSFLMCLILA